MFIRPLKLTQHVDVQGPENATTVILLHSLGTDMHLWDLQMPRLTERYRVVRLDIRGHGLSAVDALPFSMKDLSRGVGDAESAGRPGGRGGRSGALHRARRQ